MRTMTDRLRTAGNDDMTHLLARCARGEHSAWDRVLAAARELTLDIARWRYRLRREDAEDVAQVVQMRVAERLGQLRDPAAFPLWVRRLVHHAVLDHLRHERFEISLDELLSSRFAGEVEPHAADDYGCILVRADVDRVLGRLPALYREPIEMHVIEGLPQEEVGRRLGRTRSTVATQIERGLARMRRALASLAPTN